MFCLQRRRCLQQSSLTAIRFGFPCTVEKPVGEEFKLDMFHTVVIKNHFHFFERSVVQNMFPAVKITRIVFLKMMAKKISGNWTTLYPLKQSAVPVHV